MKRRPPRRSGRACSGAAAVLVAVLLPARLGALEAGIVEPAAGVPVFGEVSFVVEVSGARDGVRVELRVDGTTVARLDSPPWSVRVDVGQANASHLFEARVEDGAGRSVHRVLETPVLRVDAELEVPLRQLYVTVMREGERVLDLPREVFSVRDAGRPQELVTFEGGDVPFSALLLVDASDSMRGRRLATALGGARSFVAAMNPLDQAALVLFSDRVIHLTPFTGFGDLLAMGLEAVSAGGGTALADHLYLALELLEEQQGRRVLVVLSDGVDVASGLAMAQVREVARRGAAMVYWIRPGRAAGGAQSCAWRDPAALRREMEDLEGLVTETGGRVIPVGGIDEVVPAFREVLREVREQYVLGFSPSHRAGDGSWHRVAVRVAAPGVSVRAREGYVDE